MATRRLNNVNTFLIEHHNVRELVTLRRLNNDVNGHPRYEATLTYLDSMSLNNYSETSSRVYHFTGHYTGDKAEAEWIANYHYNSK